MMIYLFRGLFLISVLNFIALFLFGGAAGMLPVWFIIGGGSFALSFQQVYQRIFGMLWVKGLFVVCIIIFIGTEGWIIKEGFLGQTKEASDYIIVLGAQIREDKPSLSLKYRLDAAFKYLEKHPETRAILSGGQGHDEIMSEAEAMRRYLVDLGVDEDRLILEDESTSTYENLKNSFVFIDEVDPEASINIVTNYFHVLRAKLLAKQMGRDVGGIGSKTYPFLIPNYYLREFFAVWKQGILDGRN